MKNKSIKILDELIAINNNTIGMAFQNSFGIIISKPMEKFIIRKQWFFKIIVLLKYGFSIDQKIERIEFVPTNRYVEAQLRVYLNFQNNTEILSFRRKLVIKKHKLIDKK